MQADTHLGPLADSVVNLFGSRARITLHKELEPVILDSKKMFYLGIIVNELLTNALKYAFAGRNAVPSASRCTGWAGTSR